MRFDKYEPHVGGHRARLAADWTAADEHPLGVGLDVNGRVVPGNGNTGIVGVVILKGFHKKAGQVVDVMTSGECLEARDTDIVGRAAGIQVFADPATGELSNVSAAGKTRIGYTVEADRLIVRVKGVVP